ncbi:hypothetical protein [Nostoc sp. NMS4]|uniref:hypothetical protein n=1 Tax=Nostoc sp. NMS4 TaxID=2815390 RepID=UPI0025EC079B|nr:hypothetical protein [Nostoc sp. NMS4]MBN3925813.1 hypothetical protein [Nostoc sp. NMS4]
MSQITIQCRLIASESTRQKLWKLMAELNTPLINELLQLKIGFNNELHLSCNRPPSNGRVENSID